MRARPQLRNGAGRVQHDARSEGPDFEARVEAESRVFTLCGHAGATLEHDSGGRLEGREVRHGKDLGFLAREQRVRRDRSPQLVAVGTVSHKRIKRVPVVCGGQLVGIVTRSNLMHAMVSMARVAQPSAKDDVTIREKLLAEFQKEVWAPAAMTNVVVRDGVVELWGVIVDERQREAMKVAAENIPGVKAVNDHLVWVEPTSGMVIEPRDEAVTH